MDPITQAVKAAGEVEGVVYDEAIESDADETYTDHGGES